MRTRRLLYSLGVLLGLGGGAAAQPPATVPSTTEPAPTTARAADCERCHTCAQPTTTQPCLPSCARDRDREMNAALREQQGPPDVVILDDLEKAYLPVPFDHRGHARMADMAGGCVTCHHFTPEGQQHPACRTCHELTGAGTDIAKPGLKGAYHRQCLNCHKDWTDEKDCAKCHHPKTGEGAGAAVLPTKDDLLGQMHPPIPEPDTEIYRGRSKASAGSQVLFRHREHVHRFGLSCPDCHHQETCTHCHNGAKADNPERSVAEHHNPCIGCHKDDMPDGVVEISGRCRRCHRWRGEEMPEPFDHAGTGWPLKRYHQGKSCRACHKQVPFTALARDCNTCHAQWESGKFNHAVTGQVLDETHADAACTDCHRDRKFDAPPQCDSCHDAKDGFVFPSKRPGPVATPSSK